MEYTVHKKNINIQQSKLHKHFITELSQKVLKGHIVKINMIKTRVITILHDYSNLL